MLQIAAGVEDPSRRIWHHLSAGVVRTEETMGNNGNGFIDVARAGGEERKPLLFVVAVIALVFIVVICRGVG
jgi:hypothetical protein